MENEPDLELPDLNLSLDELIRQRALFEINLYDYLVNPFVFIQEEIIQEEFIQEEFWEPVKVPFDKFGDLVDIAQEDICHICTNNCSNFKKLNCCNQKMCNDCCYLWFNDSVKCPYCYQDLRDFN